MIYPQSEKDHLLGAIIEAMLSLPHDPDHDLDPPVRRWNVDAEPNAILFERDGVNFRVGLHGGVEQTDGRIASTTTVTRIYEREIQKCLGRLRYEGRGEAA